MTTVELLTAAKNLIIDPARWIKHALAMDSDGLVVDPIDVTATCFCAIGAIIQAGKDCDYRKNIRASFLMSRACGGYTVESFNDTCTHAEVMRLFDNAIELAKLLELKKVHL